MSLKLHRKRGSPNWYVRGTVRGLLVDESTRTSDRAAAEAIRIKREAECLQTSIFGRKATVSFLQAAVEYMDNEGERRYVGPLLAHFGTTPLASIDQAAIDRAAKILCPKAAPSTVNRQIHTPISAILKYAADRGWCEYRRVKRPTQPKGRTRWLTLAEADRLIEACSDHLRPLVIFLFYTGARLSEALYLDWRQVDFARGQVQFLETKNGDPRGVPLHARVLAELQALKHRQGEVFRRPDGKPYARKIDGGGQIKTAFKAACRRAGISDFTPHGCRHTWATWHYAEHRDLVALEQLGGWSDHRMVLRYTHVNVSHLAASIAALPWEKSGKRTDEEAKTTTAKTA
jgi:integrase